MARRSLALLLLVCGVAQAQTVTVTFDVQPRTFTLPATLTATWNSTGATSCTASGATDWVGAKATSGSQPIAGVVGETLLQLSCNGVIGPVTLSWVNPTKNTDGSNYTDPKNIEVYRATSAGGVGSATAIVLPHTATSHPFPGLPPGMHYFATKAVAFSGHKSELSMTVEKDLQVPTGSAPPITVTGSTVPEPPTSVVATATTGFAVKANELRLAYELDGIVGTVPMGSPCDITRQMATTGYYAINRAKYVTWTSGRRPKTVVVECAPPQGVSVLTEPAPLDEN